MRRGLGKMPKAGIPVYPNFKEHIILQKSDVKVEIAISIEDAADLKSHPCLQPYLVPRVCDFRRCL